MLDEIMKLMKRCLILIFLLPSLVFASSAAVNAARIGGDANKTRFVLSLSKTISYKVSSTQGGRRVQLDLNVSRFRTSLHKLSLNKTLFKKIKTIHVKNGLWRLMIDTVQPVTVKTFILKADKQNSTRLVFDVYPKKPVKVAQNTKMAGPVRDVIVVIDPGHGGKDPGAHGARGTQEKHVALAIAKKLQALLNKQNGVKAILTRKGDYFLTLRERTRYARKMKADLFIAIHADAYTNRAARGASVYILSKHGASSEAARWLARRENASEFVDGVQLSHKSHAVRSVLIDMMQAKTMKRSSQLANQVLKQLGHLTALHRNYVQHAGFVVLKSPDIPSILVETGFISNRGEEKRLRSSAYQARLADSILNGVHRYLLQNPPKHTVFYALKNSTVSYKVKKGDTLSIIAKRFHTNIAAIQKVNGLNNNLIWVGQVLRVPRG